jgi:hypothetical protein
MAYISRIAKAASRQVRVESFGKTGQGRDLLAVIVSKDDVFDPVAIHQANRPVIYIQNSVHAGEMDGKDASLALLRDMLISKSQAALLDRAVLGHRAHLQRRRSRVFRHIQPHQPERSGADRLAHKRH